DVKIYDTLVVQELIKSLAQSCTITNSPDSKSFKAIILRNASHLTLNAQNALRRTMEKYISTCRLILVTDSLSRISFPLRSRCLCVCNPAPNSDEIIRLLRKISEDEETAKIKDSILEKITNISNGSLRRAILMLQAIDMQDSIDPPEDIFYTDWEAVIVKIAKLISFDQDPKVLLEIRDKFYQLLTRCISGESILKKLVSELSKLADEAIKAEIYLKASLYSNRMTRGSKPVIHLEAFAANAMALFKGTIPEMSSSEEFDYY
ncbi:MAG: Subunit of heteropentameric Replication factor C (RF-C), partial [Paramarteilia canceri]